MQARNGANAVASGSWLFQIGPYGLPAIVQRLSFVIFRNKAVNSSKRWFEF